MQVKTFTGLNQYCLKNKLTRLLRAFYLGRGGSNHLSFSEFSQILQRDANLSQNAARQIIKDGNGSWWTISPNGIYITGIKRLCEAFDVQEGHLVLLPAQAFQKVKTFRAHLYASWFAHASWSKIFVDKNGMQPAGGIIIGRGKLTQLFGIDKRSQRRYEKLAHIERYWTYSYLKITEETLEFLPTGSDGKNVKLIDIDGDGKQEIVFQEANCYRVKLDCVPHRKIVGRGSFFREGAERPRRLYYDDKSAAYKAISRGKIHEKGLKILVNRTDTSLLYRHFSKSEAYTI